MNKYESLKFSKFIKKKKKIVASDTQLIHKNSSNCQFPRLVQNETTKIIIFLWSTYSTTNLFSLEKAFRMKIAENV